MTNIELANKALAIYADRDNWTYVQGGLGETADSTRIKNLYTYYRRVGKNSMTLDYDPWLQQYGLNNGKGKRCTDCSNFIQVLLETGINRGTYFYANMAKCPDMYTAPVGSVLYMNGHVGVVVTQGVRNSDGTFKVLPECVDFYKYNYTCRKASYVGALWEKAVYVTGVDYSGVKPKTLSAKIITSDHTIGDTLSAKDFEINVLMSDGRTVKNPANWTASPLKLSNKSNIITVKYKDLSTTTSVGAKSIDPVPIGILASVNGSYCIGDVLKANDFKITIKMSNGTTLINPANWSASPLKLEDLSNKITVSYKGLKTTITVAADYKNPFTDVKKTDWFYNDVMYLYEKNVMRGYDSDTFGVDGKMTRGMLVTVLYRLEGHPNVDEVMPFSDVPPEKYYTTPVAWAKQEGIVVGYSDGTFRPTNDITRQDFVIVLYNYAKYKGYDVSVKSDESYKTAADYQDVSHYAIDEVNWGYENGLIGKNSDLKPLNDITRQEAATILARFIRLYE